MDLTVHVYIWYMDLSQFEYFFFKGTIAIHHHEIHVLIIPQGHIVTAPIIAVPHPRHTAIEDTEEVRGPDLDPSRENTRADPRCTGHAITGIEVSRPRRINSVKTVPWMPRKN